MTEKAQNSSVNGDGLMTLLLLVVEHAGCKHIDC